MRTAIDRLGRLVIPKAVREATGLTAGTEVDVVADGGVVVLRPVAGGNESVVLRDGVLVYTGEATGDLEGAVAAARSRRHAALSG